MKSNLSNSGRTYIKHTTGFEWATRIFSLVIFFTGLIFVSRNISDDSFCWFSGRTLLMLVGAELFILNELIAHSFLGEPRGSGWIRKFIDEAEKLLKQNARPDDLNSIKILKLLQDVQRFEASYKLDLSPDLRKRVRIIERHLKQYLVKKKTFIFEGKRIKTRLFPVQGEDSVGETASKIKRNFWSVAPMEVVRAWYDANPKWKSSDIVVVAVNEELVRKDSPEIVRQAYAFLRLTFSGSQEVQMIDLHTDKWLKNTVFILGVILCQET